MTISSKQEKDPLTRLLQERAEGSQLTNIVSFSGRLLGEKKKRKREATPHSFSPLSIEVILLMCVCTHTCGK